MSKPEICLDLKQYNRGYKSSSSAYVNPYINRYMPYQGFIPPKVISPYKEVLKHVRERVLFNKDSFATDLVRVKCVPRKMFPRFSYVFYDALHRNKSKRKKTLEHPINLNDYMKREYNAGNSFKHLRTRLKILATFIWDTLYHRV